MDFDFSKLAIPQPSKPPSDPYKIFAGLPRLDGAPNDLWKGQSEALAQWNAHRAESDVLVSLNTGAGKTLVGILIAQSLCNEGLDNVLYVCPTNDLVIQTAAQARAIGINVTTRMGGRFDNDLFETGKTFCVTNYHSVFNGLSGLRRKYFPDAIIFDDAHVAEANMRDAFTVTVKPEDQALHQALINIFLAGFQALNREGEYRDALATDRPPNAVLVPPDTIKMNAVQIEAAFRNHGAAAHDNMKYAYAHLRDRLDLCAVVIRANVIEFTPPFLPSLTLDVFDRKVRRVYLSATLQNKADLVRAFGRTPSVIVEPNNDAGNGERLILAERDLIASHFNASFGNRLRQKHKVLVAVPNYVQAKQWESVATAPDTKAFSASLDSFRKAAHGAFVLVNRVDGIDLPHDTCRLMILDGVPRSEGLIERYQFEYLHMRTFAASRIANRLVQLFGRINRGRSDYGAFLISGYDLNVWLANDKHIALLPDLLKRQILLGRAVQSAMNVRTLDAVDGILDKVLLTRPRDEAWLTFYSQYLNAHDVDEEKTDRARRTEERNLEAAKAEAQYACASWSRDFKAARSALDAIVAETARADEKLAGWHNLWIAAALVHEGDLGQAQVYFVRARGQLGLNLVVPVGEAYTTGENDKPTDRVVANILMLSNLGRESFAKQMSIITGQLAPLEGGSAAQMEEAVRLLGEILGFLATRPDNDEGTGPDVLWRSADSMMHLGLELKTDKKSGSSYSKAEISQSLDHLSWIDKNLNGGVSLGCVLVGAAVGHIDQANPTEKLFYTGSESFVALRDRILAVTRDAYEHPVKDRSAFIQTAVSGLELPNMLSQLGAIPFVQ